MVQGELLKKKIKKIKIKIWFLIVKYKIIKEETNKLINLAKELLKKGSNASKLKLKLYNTVKITLLSYITILITTLEIIYSKIIYLTNKLINLHLKQMIENVYDNNH